MRSVMHVTNIQLTVKRLSRIQLSLSLATYILGCVLIVMITDFLGIIITAISAVVLSVLLAYEPIGGK